MEEDTFVPTSINVLRDINLLNGKNVGEAEQVVDTIKQMNKENWDKLTKQNPVNSFEKAISMYACDICTRRSHENNPIYTSSDYAGMDICTVCIEKVWNDLKPILKTPLEEKQVYSLKEIKRLAMIEQGVKKINNRDYIQGGMILNYSVGNDNRKRKIVEKDESIESVKNQLKQVLAENKELKRINKKLSKKQKLIKEILN